jgi:hypothetical protein
MLNRPAMQKPEKSLEEVEADVSLLLPGSTNQVRDLPFLDRRNLF